MLAESSRLFQLLGILQLLNTFSISSFLNTGIDHGINYDSACTAFDNALVTIKKKSDIFYAILQVIFRTKTHFAPLLVALSRFVSRACRDIPHVQQLQ